VPFTSDAAPLDTVVIVNDPVACPDVFHVDPLSVEYSTSVTEAPPSDPSVDTTASDPFPPVTDVSVGALGVVAGVPDTELDAAPLPTLFTARTCTE
jgi:hypothetical protein